MEKIHCQNLIKFGTPWGDKDPWGKKTSKTQSKRSDNQIGKSKMGDRLD